MWGEVEAAGAVDVLPLGGDGEVREHRQTGQVDLDTQNTHTHSEHTQRTINGPPC